MNLSVNQPATSMPRMPPNSSETATTVPAAEISMLKIEELMETLKKKYTVVIVTHNMQQAARVSDDTAFFLVGEVVEKNATSEIFARPQDKRTEDYITGRFG